LLSISPTDVFEVVVKQLENGVAWLVDGHHHNSAPRLSQPIYVGNT